MKIIEGKPAAVLNVEFQEPIESTTFETPEIAAKKPVEYTPQALKDENMKEPVRCVPRRIFDRDIRGPVENVPKQASYLGMGKSELEFMESADTIIPASFDEVAAIQAETTVQMEDFDVKPLQATMAQVVPATQELGQLLDETRSRKSDLKKRQRFAENILHITDSE